MAERFGYCGKITAKQGKRDELLALLLESSKSLQTGAGCDMYMICTMPEEPDSIWVNEVWRSEADHAASLQIPAVRETIAKARPLIAGFAPGIKLRPVGGVGLPPASE